MAEEIVVFTDYTTAHNPLQENHRHNWRYTLYNPYVNAVHQITSVFPVPQDSLRVALLVFPLQTRGLFVTSTVIHTWQTS